MFTTTQRQRRRGPCSRPARSRPRLEALEDRTLLSAGHLDLSFGVGGSAIVPSFLSQDQIQTVAVQPDGKVVVAGVSFFPNEIPLPVLRFNPDGTPDATFGSGGVVQLSRGRFDEAQDVALQPDGKILLAGRAVGVSGVQDDYFLLARLQSDGGLDPSFGSGGWTLTDLSSAEQRISGENARSIALQPDGKILVAGSAGAPGGGASFTTLRYNADGQLDPTFGSGGVVQTTFGLEGPDFGSSVALQPDGCIVVGGYATSYYGGANVTALARYTSDGALDPTFGSGGQVTVAGPSPYTRRVRLTPDGKILTVGEGDLAGTVVRRFLSDGQLDASFGVGGEAVTAAVGRPDLALQADDRIVVVAGNSAGRLNIDGAPDPSFGTGGILTTSFGVSRMALQADGRIVLAGSTGDTRAVVGRYDSSGHPDSTFGEDGTAVAAHVARFGASPQGVAVAPDGTAFALSTVPNSANGDVLLSRIKDLNSPFVPFESAGHPIDVGRLTYDQAGGLALQADGKVILVGLTDHSLFVARYDPTSLSPDPSFGTSGNGIVTEPDYWGRAVTVQADGKILVAADALNGSSAGTFPFALLRYLPNGTLDSAFGSAGRVRTDVGADSSYVMDVTVQPDDRILVAGVARDMFAPDACFVARYLADGALDPSFGSGGVVRLTYQLPSSLAEKARIKLQPDGKILIVNYGTLTRLKADGSPDTSFAGGGVSLGGDGVDLDLDEDGKIVVEGSDSAGFVQNFVLKRFLPDGTLDTSFADGGVILPPVNDYFRAAMALRDGKIVVLGTTPDGGSLAVSRYYAYSPVPSAGGPYTITEGQGVTLDATQSSNRSGVVLTYSWDVNGDGVFGDATGATPHLTWAQLDALLPSVNGAPQTLDVRVRIDDGQGFVATSAAPALDPTFGTAGRVQTDQPAAYSDRPPTPRLVLQADGKAIVADQGGMTRYDLDGTRDLSFGQSGHVPLVSGDYYTGTGPVRDVALQSEGQKIIVLNSAFAQSVISLTRYDSGGVLDLTFGDGGNATIELPANSFLSFDHKLKMVVDTSGRIIIAGTLEDTTSGDYISFAVARFTPDGQLDTEHFGDNGWVEVHVSGYDYIHGYAVAVQGDDKILIAGSGTDSPWESGAGESGAFLLIRFDEQGNFDPTFGGGAINGVIIAPVGENYPFAEAMALTVQPDSIIAVGQAWGKIDGVWNDEPDLVLTRYDADGRLDSHSFLVITLHDPDAWPIYEGAFPVGTAVLEDGGIVVAADAWNADRSGSAFAVFGFKEDGSRDEAFGDRGVALTGFFDDSNAIPRAMALRPDGRTVLVAGSVSEIPVLPPGTYYDNPSHFVGLAQYQRNGSIDESFDGDGTLLTSVWSDNRARAIALQADGKILVAGFSTNGENTISALTRYETSGTLDADFGPGGTVFTDFSEATVRTGGYGFAPSVLIAQPWDQKIVIAGGVSDQFFGIARYDADGSLDPTYGRHGTGLDLLNPGKNLAFLGLGSSGASVTGLLAQPDGVVWVAGFGFPGWTFPAHSATGIDFLLFRIRPDGFGEGAGDYLTPRIRIDLSSDLVPTDDYFGAIAMQADGNFLLAGNRLGAGIDDFALVRVKPDRTFETSFGDEGKTFLSVGSGHQVGSVTVLPDDKILVSGAADFDGIRQFVVLRYLANGALDTSFGTNGWVRTDFAHGVVGVAKLALEADGRIILAGEAPDGHGRTTFALARFLPSGIPDASFGPNGRFTYNFGGVSNGATAVTVQSDGRIVVAGYVDYGSGEADFAILRLRGSFNDAPVAQDATFTTVQDAPVSGEVTAIEIFPDPQTFALLSGPASGNLDFQGDGTFTYTPAVGFHGTVSFTFTASDGLLTSEQPAIVTLTVFPRQVTVFSSPANGDVILESPSGTGLANVAAISNPSPDDAPADAQFPLGFFTFEVHEGGPGGSTTVTLSLPADVTVNTYYQYGPTADNATPHWYAFLYDEETGTGAKFEEGRILLYFVDGQRGDHDLMVNGVIVDPGAPAFVQPPSRIQGLVWEDFNNDGEVNFGEKAIEGVVITLTGIDDRGNPVNRTMSTDGQGIYEFLDLRPGTYAIAETQPAGFVDGKESLGTVNGQPSGSATINDQFSQVVLLPGSDGVNYNFGERPPADGTVHHGQTAAIGFWQNRNGQNLIKSLNGGTSSTQLGDWLAATFANMYGENAGVNNLTGKTNAEVAAVFTALFKRNGQTAPGGPPKLDAQVLATALAVYVTNENLAGTTAAAYGFQVTAQGVGSATFNVGSNGAAFGVADNTTMTVLDLLLATDARTHNGLLYDLDGSGTISAEERALRERANQVYTAINEQGDI